MDFKTLFSLDTKKIIVIIILLVLLTVPGFIPSLIKPMECVSAGCTVNAGLPLEYIVIEWGAGKTMSPEFNFINLGIDIITFYLITCILFYPFRKKEEKPKEQKIEETVEKVEEERGMEQNVPNSNSGGRSFSFSR